MLKRIPKSDISIRPFKAYKEWSFDETSTEITLLEANVSSSVSSSNYPKNSIYGQLRAQFYNGLEDNPINRFGFKTGRWTIFTNAKERYLSNDAKIINIPQIYLGEGIKKSSLTINDNGVNYTDDGYGNIISDTVELNLETINFNNSLISYTNLESSLGSITLVSLNLELDTIVLTYNSITYTQTLLSIDFENGILEVDELPFLENIIGYQGNIFYNQGLIVFTKLPNQKLLTNWDLSFKSTKTIYEHEYLLIANEDEFNVSQNPTAVVEVGKETGFVSGSDGKIYDVTTNPGVKYIRKKSTLENGNIIDYRIPSSYTSSISGGFEHYDLSSSVDTTGSFLTPFITTIGLYDDNCDLVAVAKLPQPIKSYPDLPVNFIVRFDT